MHKSCNHTYTYVCSIARTASHEICTHTRTYVCTNSHAITHTLTCTKAHTHTHTHTEIVMHTNIRTCKPLSLSLSRYLSVSFSLHTPLTRTATAPTTAGPCASQPRRHTRPRGAPTTAATSAHERSHHAHTHGSSPELKCRPTLTAPSRGI